MYYLRQISYDVDDYLSSYSVNVDDYHQSDSVSIIIMIMIGSIIIIGQLDKIEVS